MALVGAPPDLVEAVVAFYADGEGAAEAALARAMEATVGDPPRSGIAHVASWDEEVALAVVEAGDDLTLLVGVGDWKVVGGWWPSMGVDKHLGAYPKLVAVVGSDARPGEDRERARADSIHFVHIGSDDSARIVGVPRDSWVTIPGRGNGKVTSALAYGGPDLLMATFENMTGLAFDGYLLTGFADFQALIDLLGGLPIEVPRDFNDRWAKAYLRAGRQILSGAETLAFARVRKTLPGGDFQRQEHGGLIMIAAQALLREGGYGRLPELLAAARPHLSTDLGPDQLLVLAAASLRVDTADVDNLVAPGQVGTAGGASVVYLGAGAEEIWEAMRAGS